MQAKHVLRDDLTRGGDVRIASTSFVKRSLTPQYPWTPDVCAYLLEIMLFCHTLLGPPM